MLSSNVGPAGNDPNITTVSVKPFVGQKPDIFGLWKKAKEFMQPGYVEAFVQSTFNAMRASVSGDFSRSTLVVGADWRDYNEWRDYNTEGIQKILHVAIGNEFGRVLVGRGGILSTEAMSALILSRKAFGGLLLSAAQNPGGMDADFGIRYNISNGGPAPEAITDRIYEFTQLINHYYWFQYHDIKIDEVSMQTYALTEIEVFDPLGPTGRS